MITEHPDTAASGRLGERLLALGLLTEQQLQQALEVQGRSGVFLGQIIVDLGFSAKQAVGALLAQEFAVRYVDLMEVQPDRDAVQLLPEHIIRETQALPLRVAGNVLHVAMVDPLNIAAIDRIHAHTGLRVAPRLTMGSELQRTLNDLFSAYVRTTEALKQLETEEDDAQLGRTRTDVITASEAPIVRLVDSLIESAVAMRASDIHFEPKESGLRVRYRVDGTLMEQTEIPRAQQAAVTARLKVLCLMDITESRRPQDGRIKYDFHGRDYDLRVSSVPTVFGEKLVLRILDKTSVQVPLDRLGFLPSQQAQFESMIRRPHGMILVVGPTGSGKSTTLYSALNLLNDAARNIMTLEDPVEYNIAGLNQVQVNSRIGLTFASGLRSFVRQDPDVILVGEIRDPETAEMAVQASLTGHLMLSTLHTNSAVGTIARLVNLGLDQFLIGQALSGVVSQRLVARICQNCAESYLPDEETIRALGIPLEQVEGVRLRRGRGCRLCRGRGNSGRMALFEVVTMSDQLRRLILRGATETELHAAAEAEGTLSLRGSATVALLGGVTTVEEVGRVVLSREH